MTATQCIQLLAFTLPLFLLLRQALVTVRRRSVSTTRVSPKQQAQEIHVCTPSSNRVHIGRFTDSNPTGARTPHIGAKTPRATQERALNLDNTRFDDHPYPGTKKQKQGACPPRRQCVALRRPELAVRKGSGCRRADEWRPVCLPTLEQGSGDRNRQHNAEGRRKRNNNTGTHSSGLMGLNWTASSVYSLRHAGQRLLRFSLMWCQQNWQT